MRAAMVNNMKEGRKSCRVEKFDGATVNMNMNVPGLSLLKDGELEPKEEEAKAQ